MYKNAPASAHKGKPTERRGRKTSGLTARAYDSGVAGIAPSRDFVNGDPADRRQPMFGSRLPQPEGSPPNLRFSRRGRGLSDDESGFQFAFDVGWGECPG